MTGATDSLPAVAVTGATGFIGSRLANYLANRGFPVVSLVRSQSEASGSPGFRVYAGLGDEQGLQKAFEGVDAIVHLAARVHVMSERAEDPVAQFRRVNVEGTRNVMRAAVAVGAERVIFVSSVKAVGEDSGDGVWDEETPADPVDPYGVSKREAELLVLEEAATNALDAVIVRIPLVYGLNMKANMLRLFRAVETGFPLPLGLIRNRRSILYLENMVAAIESVLRPPTAPTGIYFLADEPPLSSADIARCIAEGAGRRARLLPVPTLLLKTLGLVGNAVSAVTPLSFDSSHVQRLTSSLAVTPRRFHQTFLFSPPYSASEGLARTARLRAKAR